MPSDSIRLWPRLLETGGKEDLGDVNDACAAPSVPRGNISGWGNAREAKANVRRQRRRIFCVRATQATHANSDAVDRDAQFASDASDATKSETVR